MKQHRKLHKILNTVLIIVCIVMFVIVILGFLLGGCTSVNRPTAQENSDYCDGQLLICTTRCPGPPSDTFSPCRRDCHTDFNRCLQLPTRETSP